MKPTERSSVPSWSDAASTGVAVNVTSAGSAGAPSARSSTSASRTRAHPRACSFFPAATTNSTTTSPLRSGTVDGAGAEPGEEIVFVFAFGHAVVDQRAHECEFLPREHLADDVVGKAHPVPFGVDLRAVRQERCPTRVQVVADVDERRELVGPVRIETALEPRRVRALLAAVEIRLVQRLHPRDGPRHVVELRRLPGV